MSLSYVTVTGTFDDGSGAALSGTATFTPSETVYYAGTPVVSASNPVQAQIINGLLKNSSGGALTLLATDNAVTYEGLTGFFYWTVTIVLGGVAQPGWSFFLPHSPSTVDLFALASSGAGGGSVTTVSVATADGFAGTVANATTTPAITVETTVTGLLKGNGTSVSAAAAGTDYLAPGGNGSALTGLTQSQISGLVAALAALAPLAGATFTGAIDPAVVTLTDASTVTVSAAAGNDFRLLTTSGVGSTRQLGTPSSPVDGQRITVQVTQDGSGSRLLTYTTAYDFGTTGSPALSTAAAAIDILGFIYNAAKGKWLFLGAALGF